MRFKEGDEVIRVARHGNTFQPGKTYVINHVISDTHIGIEGFDCIFESKYFQLIRSKPWLRVTPPQPEKRELVDFQHGVIYSVKFNKEQNFAYVSWDELRSMPYTSQSFTKEELQEFGETLIEISKEMK